MPFAVTFMSTACWNAYGLAAPDYNMFLPNIPGFIAALYTSITCYALASKKVSTAAAQSAPRSFRVLVSVGLCSTKASFKLYWQYSTAV